MNTKKITVGCDHAAYDMKLEVIRHLEERGYEVLDVGTNSSQSCDFPVFAHAVCKNVQDGVTELGILICGTGIGMSMAANKHHGIRAAVCSDTFSARLTRMHNNANVLCFGARVVGIGLALDLVDNFLDAEFEGGKHQRRIDMVNAIDAQEGTC
ncbi:MAG: ribose 5-phosphate isomerase B [Clostridia bacterium]|nr:ribose 5-phosphate isomerase B [Clostridia bacterium]